MNTPIADFIKQYIESNTRRLHMPGHKGTGPLGFEKYDITEIKGADALYEADGIIAESERNAAALFGAGRTLYSTEGSSQCIRAMLHLAVTQRPAGTASLILAARNVHKAFVYSAALTGFDVEWLWPDGARSSICACPVSPQALDKRLSEMECTPAAVYITSPDYLGGRLDIASLARVCHARGTLLIVDNAHGAYLRFCSPSMHPIDLGADICCDSAHKTLPVLTGGAYLHLSAHLPARYADNAKQAMALFGSTSPSYLILASLDMCNSILSANYSEAIARTAAAIGNACAGIARSGWSFDHAEPMKLTIHASESGITGTALAERLRAAKIECEYADADDLVMMLTPHTSPEDIALIPEALGTPVIAFTDANINSTPIATPCANGLPVNGSWLAGPDGSVPAPIPRSPLPVAAGEQVMTIREAFFAPHETIPVSLSEGRICAAPTVACPPAIPIAVSGEIITHEAVALFRHYGVETVEVVSE